ncbi:MAG: hypothetical protein Q4F79_09130 [Eubacteriales bacterium]|nr:hypothetical protein [Eubacteriales bacterium]
MEPVPLCKGEIIVHIQDREHLAALDANSRAAAIIVDDAVNVTRARRHAGERLIGVAIEARLAQEEDTTSETWNADWMIHQFRDVVAKALRVKADFLYFRMGESLQALRAAVLAATDQSGVGILVELPVDEDGCMPDGTPLMCALGILQRIGVAGLILTGNLDEIDETISELSPHSRVALGLALKANDGKHGKTLPEAEFYLAVSEEQAERIVPLIPESDDTEDPEIDRDYILAPVGRKVHFVDATIDISDPLDLEDHFEETLLELEDVWSGAIKLEITSLEDIYLLAENQYLLERPVCLAAENPVLFEKALRVFNGIALYDGTWELDSEHLDMFTRHYGLISL